MTDSTIENAASHDVAAVQKLGQARRRIVEELRKHIVGMDEVIA